MKSDRFNLAVFLYALWIALASALFFKASENTGYTFTSIGLVVLWITGIIMLVIYVNITNKNLLVFLQSFRFHDSTIEFNKIKKFPFRPIYDEFNRIILEFKNLKQEKEMEHQYFEHVVKHVNTALIAWDENEKITLLNETAKNALGTPFIATLDGLSHISGELPSILRNLEPGNKQVIRIELKNERIPLSVNFSRFKLENRVINLAAFDNIKNELEDNESEAWQKLIKLLNHEIVNSLSPVNLVSSALVKKLDDGINDLSSFREVKDELNEGLKAIHNRSQGLLRFIEDYRILSEIPRPEIKKEQARELVGSLVHLVKDSLVPPGIKISYSIKPDNLLIPLDRKLIEQVLINLIKNSVQALDGSPNPEINIEAYYSGDHIIIEVHDNGCGIPFNIRDFVFMPFFTTKTDGSGIGLGFARQVMRIHKGMIQILTKENQGTSVLLLF